MPLTNGRGLQMSAPAQAPSAQNGRMVSSGGYDLGPSSPYTNNMMDAYNNLRRYRQQRPPQQQQQQAYQEPAPDTNGWQEANGAERFMHGMAEKGEQLSDLFGYGEAWQRTKDNWKDNKFNFRGDVLGLFETGTKFAMGLLPSTVGGLMMDPQYAYEAATGKNMQGMYNGLIDNDRLNRDQRLASAAYVGLDALSFVPGIGTAGRAGRTALSVGRGALGRQATRENFEQIAKAEMDRAGRATEHFDRVAAKRTGLDLKDRDNWSADDLERFNQRRNKSYEAWNARHSWSPSERASNALVRKVTGEDHPYIAGFGGAAVEEGVQEFAQTIAEDVRGSNGDPEGGWDNVDWMGALEAAGFGAVGGAMFHAANIGVNKARDVQSREKVEKLEAQAKAGDLQAQQRLLARAYKGDKHAIEAVNNIDWNSASDLTAMETFDRTGLRNEVNPELADHLETRMANSNRKPVGASGTMYVDNSLRPNECTIDSASVLDVLQDEKSREPNKAEDGSELPSYADVMLDKLTVSDDDIAHAGVKIDQANYVQVKSRYDRLQAIKEEVSNIVQQNQPDAPMQISKLLNEALAIRRELGLRTRLLWVKQPATNESPFYLDIREITTEPGAGVSQVVASVTNADYDGDLGAWFLHTYDHEHSGKAIRHLYQVLTSSINGQQKSNINWADADLDVMTLSVQQVVDIAKALVYSNPQFASLRKGDINLGQIAGKMRKTEKDGEDGVIELIAHTITDIARIDNKNERNYEFSKLITELYEFSTSRRGFTTILETLFEEIRTAVLLNDTVFAKPTTQQKATILKETVETTTAKSETITEGVQAGYMNENYNYPELLSMFGLNLPAPTSEAMEAGATNAIFRMLPAALWRVLHYENDARGTWNAGEERARANAFDLILMTALELFDKGLHDNAKIIQLYNALVLHAIMRKMPMDLIGPDFKLTKDFKFDDIFDDDLIEEINEITRRFDEAITNYYFRRGEKPDPEGPIWRKPLDKNPSAEQISEFMWPVLCDGLTMHQLLSGIVSDEQVLELKKYGINLDQSPRLFYLERERFNGFPDEFDNYITDENGDPLDDVLALLKGLGRASNNRVGYNENELVQRVSKPFGKNDDKWKILTKKEIKEQFPEFTDEQVDYYYEDTGFHVFARLCYSLGWEVTENLGWYYYGQFLEDPIVQAYMEAKNDQQRKVIAFSWLLHSMTIQVRNYCNDIIAPVNQNNHPNADANLVMLWTERACSNGNPIFKMISNRIRNVIAPQAEEKANQTGEEFLQVFAEDVLDFLDEIENKDTTFEHITALLAEGRDQSLIEDERPISDLPWFTWARTGLTGYPQDIGQAYKMDQADAAVSSISVYDMIYCKRQLKEMLDRTKLLKHSPETILQNLMTMALRSIRIDESVRFENIYSILIAWSQALEKAQSIQGLANNVGVIRAVEGQLYRTYLDLQTGAITGSEAIESFTKQREVLLGVVFDMTDPKTGKPYEKNVTDAKNERSAWVTHETLLGKENEENAQQKLDKILQFLDLNPNLISWLFPAKATIVEIGSESYVTVVRDTGEDYTLAEDYERVYDSRFAPEDTNPDSKKWESASNKRYREEALHGLYRSPLYDALVVAAMDLDNLNIMDPRQVENAIQEAINAVDRRYLHYLQSTFSAPKSSTNEDLEHSLNNAKYQALLMMFNTTELHEVAGHSMRSSLTSIATSVEVAARERTAAILVQTMINSARKKRGNKKQIKADVEGMDDLADISSEALGDVVYEFAMIHQFSTVLAKTGAIEQPISSIIKSVDIDQLLGHFAKEIAKDASLEAEIKNAIQSMTDEDVFGMNFNIIPQPDERGFNYRTNKNGRSVNDFNARKVDAYINQMMEFIEKHPKLGITRDDVLDLSASIMAESGKQDSMERAMEHIDAFWVRCAYGYFRTTAARRGILFSQDNNDLIKSYAMEAFDFANDMFLNRHAYDDDFVNKRQFISLCDPYEDSSVTWHFYNPANMNAMALAIDMQTSAESGMGIGLNGIMPAYVSAFGALNDYVCGNGTVTNFDAYLDQIKQNPDSDTVAYIKFAGYTEPKHSRYAQRSTIREVVEEWNNTTGATYVADDTIRIKTDGQNADQLRKILANHNLTSAFMEDVTVINQDEECTSGICKIHNPGFIAFMCHLSNKGQEERLMKIKKRVLIARDMLTGAIKPGTKIGRNICVQDRETIGGQFSPEICLRHGNFVARQYAESLKLNNDGTGDDVFAKIDNEEDWATWAEPTAKSLTVCCKLTFDNGDTLTLSRYQLEEAAAGRLNIIDPFALKRSDETYHSVDLDWSKVESIDWTPVTLDELAFHINDALRRADQDPNNTRQDWGNIANEAYNDWSNRNRRYQRGNDEEHNLTPQDVYAHVGMLRSSIPYLPKMNVLPSHRTRFLTGAQFRTGTVYKRNPNVLTPDAQRKFYPAGAWNIDGSTLVAVETNIDEHNVPLEDAPYKKLLGLKFAVDEAFRRGDYDESYYIDGGVVAVVFSSTDKSNLAPRIKEIAEKAVRSNTRLLIQENMQDAFANALEVTDLDVKPSSEPGFVSIYPRQIKRAAEMSRPRVKVPTYTSKSSPWIIVAAIKGFPTPPGDSAMLVTPEMAEHWQTTVHEQEREMAVPFTKNAWHALDENSADKVTDLKQALNDIKNIDDRAERKKKLAEVLDLSAIKPKKTDTSEQGAERISKDPDVVLDSVLNWIDSVESDPSNFHLASNVRQGTVIAMAYCPEKGKYAPIFYSGAVARNNAVISIEADYNRGSKFKYYWSCDLNMADDLDKIKAYLSDLFGFKSMLIMDRSGLSVKLSWKHGGKSVQMPLAAIIDYKAIKSRIPEHAKPWITKLTLFVALREHTYFDVMARDPLAHLVGDKLRKEYLGPYRTEAEKSEYVHKIFEFKGDLANRPEYRSFWEDFAKGDIRFKDAQDGRPVTRDQQLAIQKMVRGCLNCGLNPSLLFSSTVHGGVRGLDAEPEWATASNIKDDVRCDFWNIMLSDTPNNITVDDVMAYCNFIDDTFCPEKNITMTDQEFIDSPYFTDGELRCVFDVDRSAKFPNGPVLGNLYASKYATGGSLSVGAISNKVTMNERLIWLDQNRNGFKPGFPISKSYAGVLRQFDRYSDDDLLSMHESAPEYFEQLSLADRHDDPYGSVLGGFGKLPSSLYGDIKEEAVTLVRERRAYYRHPEKYMTVYSPTKTGKPMERKDLYEIYEREIQSIDGCSGLSFDTWLRLVECNAGWTPSAGNTEWIPWNRFRDAHDFVKKQLKAGKPPILSGRHSIPGHRNAVPVIGHIDRYWADRLINELVAGNYELSYGFDTIEAIVKKNVAECKYEGKKSPLSSVTDEKVAKVLHDDLTYADAEWNGLDVKMIFEGKFNMREELRAISEIARKYLGASEYIEEIEALIDEAAEHLRVAQEAELKMAAIELSPEGKDNLSVMLKRNKYNDSIWRFLDTWVQLRQIMAMTDPIIPFANFGDTFKGTAANALLNWLGEKGVPSPYKISQKSRMKLGNLDGKFDPVAEEDTKELILKSGDCLDYMEAMFMAQAGGVQEVARFRNAMRSGIKPRQYIEARKAIKYSKEAYGNKRRGVKNAFQALYTCVMRIGSAQNFFKRRMLKNWFNNFLRIAGERGLWYLEDDLANKIRTNPEQAFRSMWEEPLYAPIAEEAWNQALTGSMGQNSAISHLVERTLQAHPFFNFIVRSPMGFLFVRANININRRYLKKVLPFVSTTEYVLTDIMQHADISKHSVLAKILCWATKTNPEDFMAEFREHANELKMYTSLREALLIDLCHMSMPLVGIALAMSGAIQPPDDDDLYDCYWEWSFLGAPIGQQWWLMDMIGPIMPWACWWKSYMDGRPSGMLMLNAAEDFMNMSPFMAVDDVVKIFTDPESTLETYENDRNYYADTQEGAPDFLTMMSGKSKAALLSWASSFITPKIINNIYKYNNEYEVSYNRAYVYDENGDVVYNDDGTVKTEKVSYLEAQLRKVTRNNWMLGCFLDLLNSASGNDYVGYLAEEMPRQVIYDSAQLQFEHTFSVWDYDEEKYKSDEEITATCTALLMILEQNDDMNALWHQGFYLDSRTKDALSAYIWGLYQEEVDEFNDLIQSGQLDYVYLGDGDWEKGHEIASEMYEAHYNTLNYYKSLYYDKLASKDLNQGLVAYNRYNTTYEKDANGDWYATGFRETTNPFFGIMPNQAGLFNENAEATAGNAGSWATRSAVTGRGMYDQEGDPYRALDPVVQDDYPWLTFDELAQLMGTPGGAGTDTVVDTNDIADSNNNTPGGWGYTYSRGGGGGRGSSIRIANRNYASTSKAQPAYGYNYTKRLSPHSMNPVRPNFPNSMQGGRIYDPQLDYLRPNFETKGSREAYRRQDF